MSVEAISSSGSTGSVWGVAPQPQNNDAQENKKNFFDYPPIFNNYFNGGTVTNSYLG